jgi:transcriptional regulator with XRE-family HTH domain
MANDICATVGQRIRSLRSKAAWTQSMLADHAGITREHLSELENGRKEIGIRTLKRLVDALDISLHDFFDFRR